MNYWHMQLHPDNSSKFPPDIIKKILEEKSVIGLGDWPEGISQIKQFQQEMAQGDIVVIKSGMIPIALVEVIGTYEEIEETDENFDWFPIRRKIKILDFYNGHEDFPTPMKTLTCCRDLKNKTSMFIKNWYEKIKKGLNMSEYVQRLEKSKNLILTGAPGTGKTHLAKQIAMQMIGVSNEDELISSGRFEFVQFHPSYDYTDFVEGLRPQKSEDDRDIGFELKPGIFMEFCDNAKKEILHQKGEINNFDEAWDKLITKIKNNLLKGTLTKIGMWDYELSRNDTLKYISKNTPSGYQFTLTKQNVYDAYRGKQARKSGGFQKDMDHVVEYMIREADISLKKYEPETISQDKINNELKPYIFIIDEINRGEISKIFGELFFSIDPSYRGPKGAVATQYQNMHDNDDKFYVPENVYIIGTMNDIDRSVESFDFAMRRRFTWVEITAEDSAENMTLPNNIKNRMKNLNSAISAVPGLNTSYHVGGAYFLDKDGNPRGDFDNIWEFRLKPLLHEYLRGMFDKQEDLKKKLGELKDAYNLKLVEKNSGNYEDNG